MLSHDEAFVAPVVGPGRGGRAAADAAWRGGYMLRVFFGGVVCAGRIPIQVSVPSRQGAGSVWQPMKNWSSAGGRAGELCMAASVCGGWRMWLCKLAVNVIY